MTSSRDGGRSPGIRGATCTRFIALRPYMGSASERLTAFPLLVDLCGETLRRFANLGKMCVGMCGVVLRILPNLDLKH